MVKSDEKCIHLDDQDGVDEMEKRVRKLNYADTTGLFLNSERNKFDDRKEPLFHVGKSNMVD